MKRLDGSRGALTEPAALASKYVLKLVCCTETLLMEIELPNSTRDDIAVTYALALVSGESTDWKVVNKAILARWSLSALVYIKRKAWNLARFWEAAKRRGEALAEPQPDPSKTRPLVEG
jgi:hypothetical protein